MGRRGAEDAENKLAEKNKRQRQPVCFF